MLKSDLNFIKTKAHLIELLNKVQTRLGAGLNSKLLSCDSNETCLRYEKNFVSPSERTQSQLILTLIHQRIHFANEMKLLKQKGCLPKTHLLHKLRLYIKKKVIRVGGRLGDSLFLLEKKHPLLIYPHDYLTRLVIRRVHLDTLHCSASMTLGTLRLTNWVDVMPLKIQ